MCVHLTLFREERYAIQKIKMIMVQLEWKVCKDLRVLYVCVCWGRSGEHMALKRWEGTTKHHRICHSEKMGLGGLAMLLTKTGITWLCKKGMFEVYCQNGSNPKNACVACETWRCVTAKKVGLSHWQTDTRTDRQTSDKVIPMYRYATQATKKMGYTPLKNMDWRHKMPTCMWLKNIN